MKIIIDARAANYRERKTGVQHYVYELINAIAQLNLNNTEVRVLLDRKPEILLTQNTNIEFIVLNRTNIIYHTFEWVCCRMFGLSVEYAWNVWLTAYLKLTKWGVFYCIGHGLIPNIRRDKLVISIQDIGYEKYPEYYDLDQGQELKAITDIAISRSSHIIVPSHSTENDLINIKHLSKTSITVVYHGGPAPVAPNEFDPNMLLCLTAMRKNKNIFGLLKAFSILIEAMPGLNLTIAGENKEKTEFKRCIDYLKMHNLQEKITFAGYVTEQRKKQLLLNACLFIVPSYYEGFGLQVIEAIRHGCPVAASNVGPLKELLPTEILDTSFDPNNIQQMAECIKNALTIVYNGRREEIVAIQKKHVEKFTWERSAKETIAVLRNSALRQQ